MAAPPDTLEKTVRFLAKREGIDKTLKIIRYTSRLLAALAPPGSETNKRFDALQSSLGTSRKAYRLGKFLQNVNNLRKLNLTKPLSSLEVAAHIGEGVYYFAEQFSWLMKTGFLDTKHEKSISTISAYAETVGYIAGIIVNLYRISLLSQRDQQIVDAIHKLDKDGEDGHGDLEQELQVVRHLRLMRVAFVVQDLSDLLLTVPDLRGPSAKGSLLSHPVLLSLAGLVSASVSTYKNWAS